MHDPLYQARILDHAAHPRNKKVLNDADLVAKGSNPSCGDKLTLYMKCDGDTITDASFEGEGCAISQASASVLTGMLSGMTLAEAGNVTKDDLFRKLGIEVSIVRQKCALLAWHALHRALEPSKRRER